MRNSILIIALNHNMITPKCDKCGNELQTYGGLVFSPPDDSTPNQVNKYHLCVECWDLLFKWLRSNPNVNFSATIPNSIIS